MLPKDQAIKEYSKISTDLSENRFTSIVEAETVVHLSERQMGNEETMTKRGGALLFKKLQ